MIFVRTLASALLLLSALPAYRAEADPAPSPEASPDPAASADASPSGSHFSYHENPPHFESSRGYSSPSSGRALGSGSSHGGDHSHCALLVPGLGKSSGIRRAFGGSYNDIHSEDVTCVSFASVDAAFSAARRRHGLARPEREDNAEQRAELGEILLETTELLAEEYHLPKDVIVNGLPLIDTHKTIIGTVCSDFTRPGPCKVEKYRTVSGRCNNLDNPHWGSRLSTFKRYLLPDYQDGLDSPRTHSRHGPPLPSPRAVSAHIHRDEGLHDHAITIMAVAWGQAIDHDMTLTAETKLPGTTEDPKCCDRDRGFPACDPIQVSANDPFYSLFNQKCISMTRSMPGLTSKCKLGPRTQINEITSYLDANWVYGNAEPVANAVRLFKGGLLKALPVFREFGLKDLLPLKLDDPDNGCIRPNKEVFCFLAGDNRVNEQLVLAVIHTLMMREHNRIVTEMAKVNAHWGDERLYQEGRRLVGAIIQHISYNEFLPMILGKDEMQKHKVILEKNGYFEGYDPKVDASVTSQFVTASFRFGHSLLPSTIERWSPNHKYIASQRLSEMLRQPYDLYKGGWCDQYIMGLANQVAQAMDDAVSQEVTNHLFQEPNKKFGMDLAAINMQRAREHGVPGYNDFREFCGMPRLTGWDDLSGWMSNKTSQRYREVYQHPDDIDLWSGGVSERPLPGSMVGPTYSCLIGRSFKDLRYGDRFWYENPGQPSSFTPYQLEEIRKVKLSRVICDNSDDIQKIQVYTMVLPDHEINPRVPCKAGVLPSIDFSKWAEPNPHGSRGHHASEPLVQNLNLPTGTLQHFDLPGSSGNSAGAGLGLLNVGPPLEGLNSVDSGDKHLVDFDFGSSAGFGGHHEGVVPHQSRPDHHEDQYGSSVATGFSEVSHRDFGPVKHDDLLSQRPKHVHESSNFAFPQESLPVSSISYSGPHESTNFGKPNSHSDISFGKHHESSQFGAHSHGISEHSMGSVPYSSHPSPHVYGHSPKYYGPPMKPYAGTPYVIPTRNHYNRPHGKGKRGKKGSGYLKKFMGYIG